MEKNISHWILPGLKKTGPRVGAMSRIEETALLVSNYFNQDIDEVKGQSRKIILTTPRQIIIWICVVKHRLRLRDVGKYFDRDHTTIIHSKQRTFDLMQFDKDYKRDISNILELLSL